jgi:hypothetical protein
MTPQLRQVNVTYVDVQDRLLLKVSTSEDEEFRVWCTRRFTRLLMERLEESFQQEMPAARVEAVPEPVRREVAQMQHKQAVQEESFQQPYQAEPKEYPLGEEGLLVTTLKYKALENKSVQMHLGDNEGRGVSLNLDENLKHQLYELFERAAAKAQWFDISITAGASAVVH